MVVTPSSLARRGIVEVAAFALPMARRFRGTTVREGLLLHGRSGWGEWAPFPEYDDAVAARWLSAALEAATGAWPAAHRSVVTVNAIVPALSPQQSAQVAREAYEQSGATTFKVKVAEPGQSLEDDVARVAAVRGAVPAGSRFRVDANGGWTAAQAREVLASLGELEYVEQPCAALADCAAVRELAPVALDESVRLAPGTGGRAGAGGLDELRAAADVVVLKPTPLGGVEVALTLAARIGRPVVVSGAMDSAVGLGVGLALAAALPDQQYAAGLGTGRLLGRDVTSVPVVPREGVLPVARHAPDRAALAAVAMPADRLAWWQARLERALALLLR